MYAIVKNYFNEVDEKGNIPLFIEINNPDEFYLYQFMQTLLLIAGENPYNIETTLDLEAIQYANISIISSSINKLISTFQFLGTISFSINTKDYDMFIDVQIVLNRKINGKSIYTQSIPIGDNR